MTIRYISDDAALASVSPSSGDVLLFASGGTFSASAVPAGMLSVNDLTVGYYGTGPAPIITGGAIRSDWTFDAGNNVYSRPAYASNTLGNVTEDGIPMKFVPWTTNLATTAALMVSGQSLPFWSGSMTYDPTSKVVYIRPSSGAASGHVYVVSEVLNGLPSSSTARNLTIDGLEFRSLSRHGIDLKNKTGLSISNCAFRVIGGVKPASLWLGNGIELSLGVWGAETTDCEFHDIFDSPVTSQLYESTPAAIGSHLWRDLALNRYGLAGVEISCQTQNMQEIRDIEIANITSTGNGVGWSGDRNGSVITCLTQGGTSRVNRAFARNVNGNIQKRLYLGYQHAGLCGIEDSTGAGTYGQAPRSDANGRAGQVDLWRNVADNLGAPSGGQWSQVSASLRDNFSGCAI
jgi:hypothetical protein